MGEATNGIGRSVLPHNKMFKVMVYLSTQRDRIEKERLGVSQVQAEVSGRVGFRVSRHNVVAAAAALDPPIEWRKIRIARSNAAQKTFRAKTEERVAALESQVADLTERLGSLEKGLGVTR